MRSTSAGGQGRPLDFPCHEREEERKEKKRKKRERGGKEQEHSSQSREECVSTALGLSSGQPTRGMPLRSSINPASSPKGKKKKKGRGGEKKKRDDECH